MTKPTLQDLEFLAKSVIFPFYQVQRQTPLRFEEQRLENDAEHSWSLAFVAAALAPHVDQQLDTGKICQYATVHDLVEIHAGDTSSFGTAQEKATKEEREQQALAQLRKELKTFPWITDTIEAYEAQADPEARFVKSVDKLIALLFDYAESGLFYQENKITLESWQEQLQTHRKKAATHEGAFAYYDELWNLLLNSPHFFHQPAEA